MSQKLEQLQEEIVSQFGWKAVRFFDIAFDNYKATVKYGNIHLQPAGANFCISIELVLKAFIAKYAFPFLYVNLPSELQFFLNNPETFDEAILNRHIPDLKSFSKFKTIGLDRSVGLIRSLKSERKDELLPFIEDLSHIRNPSVHSILPSFQKFELERITYAATKVFQHFYKNQEFNALIGFWDDEKKQIIKNYEAEIISVVKKKIKKAKERATSINFSEVEDPKPSLENFIVKCPVCSNNAILFGETDIEEDDEDGQEIPIHEKSLWFSANEFKCPYCSLHLEGYNELENVGIDSLTLRKDYWELTAIDHFFLSAMK